MILNSIMSKIDFEILQGDINLEVRELQYDSRKVRQGDVFFCVSGYVKDGNDFIQNAIDNGAVAVVTEKEVSIKKDITVIKVSDIRKSLAVASSNYYGNPKDKLKIIGVTGTNGKTTTTYILKDILEKAGFKVGLIGTIANFIGDKKIHSERTTPESLELHSLFNEMVKNDVEYCVMEVSSHSLSLDRVYGIEFCEGIFTNLTRDHLDFHKTFDEYFKAKLMLFKNSKNSIINIDDAYGEKILWEKNIGNVKTYSIDNKSNLKASNIVMNSNGLVFDVCYEGKKYNFSIPIPGKYNIMNSLGAALACLNQNIDIDVVIRALQVIPQVPGRCEIISNKYDLNYSIILDYAHTPDGLSNVLTAVKEFSKGRLITVFGCGGDRDREKRPMMGKIATDLSDLAVITSDNPRSENPMSIIDEILKGVEKDNYLVIENRKEAIRKALNEAMENDVIVIAGKGHEDYQVLKDRVIHFDEREVVDEILKEEKND